MTMYQSLKTGMPLLSRHEGVWEGYYRYYNIDGNKIDEHKSRLVCRFPTEHSYHQTNYYFWQNGAKETRDFPTRIENNKIIFFGDIDGWAAEVPLDDHNRTVMLYWTRKNEPDLYLYEMIQVSDCGTRRSRVWQWFKNDHMLQRTLINEHLVSRDWRAYEDLNASYDDIANFKID